VKRPAIDPIIEAKYISKQYKTGMDAIMQDPEEIQQAE